MSVRGAAFEAYARSEVFPFRVLALTIALTINAGSLSGGGEFTPSPCMVPGATADFTICPKFTPMPKAGRLGDRFFSRHRRQPQSPDREGASPWQQSGGLFWSESLMRGAMTRAFHACMVCWQRLVETDERPGAMSTVPSRARGGPASLPTGNQVVSPRTGGASLGRGGREQRPPPQTIASKYSKVVRPKRPTAHRAVHLDAPTTREGVPLISF